MRNQALAYLCIVLTFINACGRNEMTESLAMDTLSDLPMSTGMMATSFDDSTPVTADNLAGLVQHLVDSGEVELRGAARMAVSVDNQVDMKAFNDLMTLLQTQKGKKPSVLKLASGIMAMNAGNATKAGVDLEAILALISQLAPLIAAVAPQFAPIIMAITTLLPLVIQIINMFKKPSAAYGALVPAAA